MISLSRTLPIIIGMKILLTIVLTRTPTNPIIVMAMIIIALITISTVITIMGFVMTETVMKNKNLKYYITLRKI